MALEFWKVSNNIQKLLIVFFTVLLVALLVINIFYPGLFTTNIR